MRDPNVAPSDDITDSRPQGSFHGPASPAKVMKTASVGQASGLSIGQAGGLSHTGVFDGVTMGLLAHQR